MPYIPLEDRVILDSDPDAAASSPGELNYQITRLCVEYLDWRGISYSSINEIVGVLECAKHEFLRRVADPYETKKCEVNGDVY